MENFRKENYVNVGKASISLVYNYVIFIFFAVFGLGTIGVLLTGYIDKEKMLSQSEVAMQYILFISFLVLSFFMVKKSIKKIIILSYVTKFIVVFKDSKDGVINISNLVTSTLQDERKIIKYFSEALKYGYLKNCRFERKEDTNYIVLNRAIYSQSDDFKEIVLKDVEEYNLIDSFTCPSCGAKIKIKDRNNVICEYCRTRYTFKREVDKQIKKASD